VLKLDASRIVQFCCYISVVSRGRVEVAGELKGWSEQLAQNKYSKVRFLPFPLFSLSLFLIFDSQD